MACKRSHCFSLCRVVRIRAGILINCIWVPSKARDFILRQAIQKFSGAHQHPIHGYRERFPASEGQSVADSSLLSIVRVKKV